jgi:O-antigen/teichoic acid export membrane protein
VALMSFAILTNVDVILVKHFFSALDAGYYSIAQLAGKIFLFLPSALAIVISPKSTTAYVTNSNSHKILYKSLLLAAVLCGIGIVVCFLFPDFVLFILSGKSNNISISLIGLFSLAMSFYALEWIVINYLLAVHSIKFALPLLCLAVLKSVIIYSYHPDLISILYILLTFSVITFLLTLYFARGEKESKNGKFSREADSLSIS